MEDLTLDADKHKGINSYTDFDEIPYGRIPPNVANKFQFSFILIHNKA
jgi:hypothetical protein